MDFVSQVVAAKETSTQKTIDKMLNNLMSDTEILKSRIHAEICTEKKILCERKDTLEKFSPEIDKLLQQLEALKNTNVSSDKLINVVNDINYLKNTIQIDCLLSTVVRSENKMLTVQNLLACQKLVSENEKNKEFATFFNLTKERLMHYRSYVVLRAVKTLNKSVLFSSVLTAGDVITQMEFNCKLDELPLVFQALLLINQDYLIEFSRKLFNNILVLFLKSCKVNVIGNILMISYEKKSLKMPPALFVLYFSNVFDVLKRHLNVVEENGSNLLKFIGQRCSKNLTKLLVDNYLISLNGDWEVMMKFYKLVHDLSEFGFISTSSADGTKTAWEYIIWPNNSPPPPINNNIVQNYLSDSEEDYRIKSSIISLTNTAIACIKKSILKTSIVDSFKMAPPESWKFSDHNGTSPSDSQYVTASVKNDLSGHIIIPSEEITLFPQCRVSESIEELMFIMSKIFELISVHKSYQEEDGGKSTRIVSQYTLLVHNILSFYLFYDHCERECAESSALIYNNSMYIVRKLLSFGFSASKAFVKKLEYHGLENLNSGIMSQRNLLRNCLEPLDNSTELPRDWNSCVDAALVLLEHLKNCWRPILPVDIFHQALGYLCNDMLQQIITLVQRNECDGKVKTNFEGIEPEVVLRIGNLFQEPDREFVFDNYIKELDNFSKLSIGSD